MNVSYISTVCEGTLLRACLICVRERASVYVFGGVIGLRAGIVKVRVKGQDQGYGQGQGQGQGQGNGMGIGQDKGVVVEVQWWRLQ